MNEWMDGGCKDTDPNGLLCEGIFVVVYLVIYLYFDLHYGSYDVIVAS